MSTRISVMISKAHMRELLRLTVCGATGVKTKITKNFRITIIGGYSWTHQKCVNTIQSYDPSRDTWERPGNLPIELSGVKAAVLCIPYSLSASNKKASSVSFFLTPLGARPQTDNLAFFYFLRLF